MKRYFRKILVFIVFFGFVVFIREVVLKDFNYFESQINSEINTKFSESATILEVNNKNLNLKATNFKSNAYLIISEKDTIHYSKGFGKPIIWKIEQLKYGNIFFPFYRYLKFEVKLLSQAKLVSIKLSKEKIRQLQISINGESEIIGDLKISRLSSVTNDKKIINEEIIKKIDSEMKNFLSSLDVKYQIE